MKVRIKKLNEHAVMPKYATPGDAGMDLTAVSKRIDEHGNVVYGTGLAFEIPDGHVGLLFPRSSNSKKDLLLSNSIGVLDSGYRGEVLFKFKPSDCRFKIDELDTYQVGNRIGQIIILPYPQIEFELINELSDTQRGPAGFGSTGK